MTRLAGVLTAAVLLTAATGVGAVVIDADEDGVGARPSAAIGDGAAGSRAQLAAVERSAPVKIRAAAVKRKARDRRSLAVHRDLNGQQALAVTRKAFPKLVTQKGFRAARPERTCGWSN